MPVAHTSTSHSYGHSPHVGIQCVGGQLIGNPQARSHLKSAIAKGRVGHAWLFAGPSGVGKALFAYDFAATLVAGSDPTTPARKKAEHRQHPDIHVYKPEGKTGLHPISAMRLFADEVALPPYESSLKVFIIEEADRMLTYSANALLKTFEEPSAGTVIILTSSSPEALLPTLLSRCRTLSFQPVEAPLIAECLQREYRLPKEQATALARQARGSIGRACEIAKNGDDAKRLWIIELLATRRFTHFATLDKYLTEIHDRVEEEKKEREKWLQSTYNTKDLSAVQREQIEQEIQGAISMKVRQEVTTLLEAILDWYRDAHLLAAGGGEEGLFFPQHRDVLMAGGYHQVTLDTVIKAVDQARLAIDRSVRFSIALQHLFLSLSK